MARVAVVSIEREPVAVVGHVARVGVDDMKAVVDEAKAQIEADMIRAALVSTGFNQSKAARLLKISLRALVYKIEEYKIPRREESA